MRRIVLPILSLLAVACSKDFDEVTLEKNKAKITLGANPEETLKGEAIPEKRTFTIAEHSAAGSSIGFLTSTHTTEGTITYTLNSDTDIDIDQNTGELRVGANLKLDFERTEDIPFVVSAFDGKTLTEKKYTLKIKDVDETAILTAKEKELIDYFQYLSLWKGPGHSAKDTNRKWETEMKLHLDGTISDEFRASAERIIVQYNTILSAGNFKISLVKDAEHANANLFFGPKAEIEGIWPDMYEIIKDGNYAGYTKTPSQKSIISSTRIWLSNPLEALFKHELGHALGFGHSNKCEEEDSFLCSKIGADNDISAVEEQIIRYMYHAGMPAGLSEAEIETVLANLIVNEE